MAGNKSNLKKIGRFYYLRYRVNGKEILKSLKTTKLDEAEDKRKEILGAARDVKTEADVIQKTARAKKLYNPKKFPIDSLWFQFEKHLKRKGSSEDCINRYKLRIKQFTEWIESNHTEITSLADVSDVIAKEYADYLNTTGLSSKTHNDVLNAITLVFDTFQDDAGLSRNSFRKTNVPRKELMSISRQEFSEENAKLILDSFRTIKIIHKEELEVLFYLGIFSGLRLKDAVLLQWNKIDFKQNRIAVVPEKTKKYGTIVNVPLHPSLREKLQSALSWKINNYVLPSLAERYNQSRDSVVRLVSQVLKLNGFDSESVKDESLVRARSAAVYGFHSLRYSFACFCARAGVPIGMAQELMGHKSPSMTLAYTRYAEIDRQKAIQRLQITEALEQSKLRESVLKRLEVAPESLLKKVISLMDKE